MARGPLPSHQNLTASPKGPLGAPLKALEFFSGIGGLRLGLDAAIRAIEKTAGREICIEIAAAYDISTTANKVYEYNFRESPKCVSIEHLSLRQVDGVADIWLLSPPCQPYTRGGKKLDTRDGRARGFLCLLDLLERCTSPPSFLFIENVRGFEASDTHGRLQEVLKIQNCTCREFLLSPTQIGIPNTRVRYYGLAARRPLEIQQHQGRGNADNPNGLCLVPPCVDLNVPGKGGPLGAPPMHRIEEFLEKEIPPEEMQTLLVSPSRLSRFFDVPRVSALKASDMGETEKSADAEPARDRETKTSGQEDAETEEPTQEENLFRLELITPNATVCGTFTKGYGQNLHSGGPLLLIESPEKGQQNTPLAANSESAPPAEAQVLRPCSLETGRFRRLREGESVRFFSSREMLRLHGFPESFKFPPSLPFRKRAALVGNSINVQVVALLLRHLLQKHLLDQDEPEKNS